MNIAYLRVSTDKQHIANQEEEIKKFALTKGLKIDQWYREVISGTKDSGERAIAGILERAKRGDGIIVSEISRLSRKMYDIMSIFNTCLKNDITLYSVKEGYVIGDDISSKVTGFAFSLVAEIERNLISMRTKEALAIRKANGVILGRPKGSGKQSRRLEQNRKEILLRLENGESVVALASSYSVSRSTLYAYFKSIELRKTT